MDREQQELLKRAECSFEEAINLACMIEDNVLGLPISDLLHLYAVLVKWRKHYEEEIEICRKNKNVDLEEACKVSVALIQSHLWVFEDIFRDWEIQIRDYFKSLSDSMTTQALENAEIFAEMADKNEDMAFHDWKSLLADIGK